MDHILQPGQTVTTTTGNAYTVQEFLGGSGQGETYRVTSGGKDLAFIWFFPSAATEQKFTKITKMVQKGSPDSRFLWPFELVSDSRIKGFGYVSPLREKRFKSFIDVMKRKVDPSFFTLITAAINITECIQSLHNAGWCLYEISFSYFDFDPQNGDVCINNLTDIIDLFDTVPGPISCSPKWAAPEIVREESGPSTDTDLYSLSVLLFYMFFISHPLDGKKETSIMLVDSAVQKRLYGTEPVFIFDPDDDSNRLDPLHFCTKNVLIFWAIYPKFFKDMFTQAFTAGLKDPDHGRLKETEWRKGLIRLRDSIIYCQNCHCENFLDIDAKSESGSKSQVCWNCSAQLAYPLMIKIDDQIVALNITTQLFKYLLDGISSDHTTPFARVRQHPQHPEIWGLQNLSDTVWTAVRPDGSETKVPPQKSITLNSGLKIQFGEKTGIVVSNNLAENTRQEIRFVDEKKVNELLDEGISLSSRGKHEEALAVYDTAISMNPKSKEAWNNKGFVLKKLGRYQEAISAFEKAVDIDPAYKEVYINCAGALLQLGKYQDAIDAFDKAIHIDPKWALPWNNKGFILSYHLHRYQEGFDAFETAVHLDPDYTEAKINRERIRAIIDRPDGPAIASLNEEASQQVQRAIQMLKTPAKGEAVEILHSAMGQFEKILMMDPRNVHALHNKAYCLLHLGKYEEAIDYCDKALAIDPSYRSARNLKGWAYHNLGQYDLAEKMWIDVRLR